MRAWITVMWGATFLVWGTAIAITAHSAAWRASESNLREHELRSLASLLEDRRVLRAKQPKKTTEPGSLQPRIMLALKQSGVGPTALSGLSPGADATMAARDGAWTAKRRKATLILQGLTLPDLGRCLAHWRALEPEWIVSSIELAPSGTAPGGGDLPLRAILELQLVEFAGAEGR